MVINWISVLVKNRDVQDVVKPTNTVHVRPQVIELNALTSVKTIVRHIKDAVNTKTLAMP